MWISKQTIFSISKLIKFPFYSAIKIVQKKWISKRAIFAISKLIKFPFYSAVKIV